MTYVFKSFGDTHTTVPVEPHESERAGRFVRQAKTECGIHTRTTSEGAPHGGALVDLIVKDAAHAKALASTGKVSAGRSPLGGRPCGRLGALQNPGSSPRPRVPSRTAGKRCPLARPEWWWMGRWLNSAGTPVLLALAIAHSMLVLPPGWAAELTTTPVAGSGLEVQSPQQPRRLVRAIAGSISTLPADETSVRSYLCFGSRLGLDSPKQVHL